MQGAVVGCDTPLCLAPFLESAFRITVESSRQYTLRFSFQQGKEQCLDGWQTVIKIECAHQCLKGVTEIRIAVATGKMPPRAMTETGERTSNPPRRVSAFITCLVDVFFPSVGEAMVRVLRRLGVEVDFPRAQTCCGQAAFNAGYRPEARRAALHFLEVFEASETVVCPSGSCTAMVKQHYPSLFAAGPEVLLRKFEELALAVHDSRECNVRRTAVSIPPNDDDL